MSVFRPPTIEACVLPLLEKYERLARLRAHPAQPASWASLRAFAQQFPGVLRQLERLPGATLAARQETLAALAALPTEAKAAWCAAAAPRGVLIEAAPTDRSRDRWLLVESRYHGLLRAVLRIRRWRSAELGRGPDTRGAMQVGARDWVQDAVAAQVTSTMSLFEDEPERAWLVDAVPLILAPPRGRLNRWALAVLAQYYDSSEDLLEVLLFGGVWWDAERRSP